MVTQTFPVAGETDTDEIGEQSVRRTKTCGFPRREERVHNGAASPVATSGPAEPGPAPVPGERGAAPGQFTVAGVPPS
jgi:hypothetical protein